MAFELYFSVSRTAVELLTLAVITVGVVYVAKDLLDEEEKNPVVNPVEG